MTKKPVSSLVKIAFAAALIIAFVLTTVIISNAQLVNVYTKENPSLTLEHIYDNRCEDGWMPSGTLEQKGGKYHFNSNSWCFWTEYDALDFAYTKADFNTGPGSVLTISVNLESYVANGGTYSSTGIMIRESLSADSRGVFLFVRGSELFLMYRQQASNVLPYTHFVTDIEYPLELKMVVNKDRKKIYGYLTSKGKKQVAIGPISFDAANKLYVGLATHSLDEKVFDKTVYSNLKISLDAPEGWTYDEDSTESDAGESSKPEVVLPEDLPVSENTLLSETFTKGILLGETENTKNSVTTPLWTVRSGDPKLEVEEENRYLIIGSLDTPLMMTAGSMEWTDYKISAQFKFSSELTSLAESNTFSLLLRHRSVVIGGSGEYSVRLTNKFSANGDTMYGQYLQLCYRELSGEFVPKKVTVLKEVCLNEGGMLPFDIYHTLTAEAFDDTIKIFLNGELKIDFPSTAEDELKREEVDKKNMHLIGNVGIYAESVSATVDNIVVEKLTDVNGGDFDNTIAGRFDEPIPDYIAEEHVLPSSN